VVIATPNSRNGALIVPADEASQSKAVEANDEFTGNRVKIQSNLLQGTFF
jgi:hypothetical protein